MGWFKTFWSFILTSVFWEVLLLNITGGSPLRLALVLKVPLFLQACMLYVTFVCTVLEFSIFFIDKSYIDYPFTFLDIKQHFINVMFVRRFSKENQVWKCIFGHIQVKHKGTLSRSLCNYLIIQCIHMHYSWLKCLHTIFLLKFMSWIGSVFIFFSISRIWETVFCRD